MKMEDLLAEIKKAFRDVKEISCEECKYQAFIKKLDKLCLSNLIFEELRQELNERHEYESHKWTKIFKIIIAYIGAPVYASYITTWFYENFKPIDNLWLGFLLISLVFFGLYIVFGGMGATIIYVIDIFRNEHNMLMRFLQRYVREKRLKENFINNG